MQMHNWLQLGVVAGLFVVLTPLLGGYMAQVYAGGRAPGDRVLGAVDRTTPPSGSGAVPGRRDGSSIILRADVTGSPKLTSSRNRTTAVAMRASMATRPGRKRPHGSVGRPPPLSSNLTAYGGALSRASQRSITYSVSRSYVPRPSRRARCCRSRYARPAGVCRVGWLIRPASRATRAGPAVHVEFAGQLQQNAGRRHDDAECRRSAPCASGSPSRCRKPHQIRHGARRVIGVSFTSAAVGAPM